MASQTQQQAFAVLEDWVQDPSNGLPEEFFLFLSRFAPLVNVDLLIQDDLRRTLLTWRDDDIYGAGWHVPGGIIRFKETAEDRIRATALRELGTAVSFDPQPFTIEQAMRKGHRERGHFVSLVYRCRLLGQPDPKRQYLQGRPERDQWAWHDACPPDLIVCQEPYRRFF